MVINCLCVCLYLGLSPSRAFSFLIYCSDLLWYVGAIPLGCLPWRGSVEFRYLHEARCLSAAKKKKKKIEMTSSQESSVYPNQDLLSTLSVLWYVTSENISESQDGAVLSKSLFWLFWSAAGGDKRGHNMQMEGGMAGRYG